jgi:hypothetical protein
MLNIRSNEMNQEKMIIAIVSEAYEFLARKHNTTLEVIARELANGNTNLNDQFSQLIEVGRQTVLAL